MSHLGAKTNTARAADRSSKRGRPTSYFIDLLILAERYPRDFEDYGHSLPTVAGLAAILGVTRETIHRWASDPRKPGFGYAITRLMNNQAAVLLNQGLRGELNTSMVAFLLKRHHGYGVPSED